MSFQEQMEDALPSLVRFSVGLTRDPESAEDLVHDVVVRALDARETFDGKNMKAWLFTIAKNHFVNGRRRAAVARRVFESASVSPCGLWRAQVPAAPDARWSGRDVRRAMASLNRDQRDAVEQLAEGRSYKEIAGSGPIGTVMSRIHRARARFAEATP